MDLKFPHHECEIAQSVGAYGIEPVRYWMHSNMLTVNGEKMSKSKGNSFLPRELFTGSHPLLSKAFAPMAVRFFMLQSHYSSTLDFSNEALQSAEKGYKKLMNALDALNELPSYQQGQINEALDQELQKLVEDCYKTMSDDFNTAKALAVLFEMASRINDFKSGNKSIGQVGEETFKLFKNTYTTFIHDVLGLREDHVQDNGLLDAIINMVIEIRKKARNDKNFALSDKIRDDLKEMGVQLKDGKEGTIDYVIE